MSNTDTAFSRQINKSTKIVIFPVKENIDSGSSLYAINWFNLKNKWLYNFYNKLASPQVLKVGGKVHFKGFLKRKISGNDADGRDALLIVNYTGPNSFLDMVSKTYFQLISVLRISAVRQFNFAFTQRVDSGSKIGGTFTKKYYLAHHYRNVKNSSTYLNELSSILKGTKINSYYAGEKAASIVREDQKGVRLEAPFLMHGIIVLEADNESRLEEFVKSETYQSFLKTFESNYLAIFERVA